MGAFDAALPPSFGAWSLVCNFMATFRISATNPGATD
jgi:hypothetical protein